MQCLHKVVCFMLLRCCVSQLHRLVCYLIQGERVQGLTGEEEEIASRGKLSRTCTVDIVSFLRVIYCLGMIVRK